MSYFQPFIPGATVSISATNSSGSVPLKPSNPNTVRVYNAGSATVFIRAGKSDVAATTSDTPVPSGAIEIMDLTRSAGRDPCTHVAAITAASTATVYFTAGQGA